MAGQLSKRGNANVSNIMPRIPPAILQAGWLPNEGNVIDLSMAENWLIRDEILDIQKNVASHVLESHHLDFPKGFWGNPELLRSLSDFFNKYFDPRTPVLPAHIALAPGAAGCIDAVLYNICDAGDGVLVPAPYWNGYDSFCRLRAQVAPVMVPVHTLEDFASFIPSLENTLKTAPNPIKALILSNPHNPLGRCFSRPQLEACLKFCQTHNLHLISDEVFGPITFQTPDLPPEERFVSILSLDCATLGVDPARVHAIWSPSKVFALTGLRLGCTITQSNPALRDAHALAAFSNVSILSILLTTALLRSPRLEAIMQLSSSRHAEAYGLLTAWCKRLQIPYLPCNAAPFLMVKIVPGAKSWEEEAAVVSKIRERDVWVSPGRGQHLPEHAMGWARLTFALEPKRMAEALGRIEEVLFLSRGKGDSVEAVVA